MCSRIMFKELMNCIMSYRPLKVCFQNESYILVLLVNMVKLPLKNNFEILKNRIFS